MYEAKNVDVSQFPFKKTGNPATSTIIVEPMNPTHAAYGWKGAFQGRVSRLMPWALSAA